MLSAKFRDGAMQARLRPEARLDIYEASRFYDRLIFVRPLSRLVRCVDSGARWSYNRGVETIYGN